MQCHLDSQGATDLVIDLVISNHSSRIFQEAIELAIALLDGGNSVIQVCHIYGIIRLCLLYHFVVVTTYYSSFPHSFICG